MENQRQKIYENLEQTIGNTPLVQYKGKTPNGNTIWIKREFDNHFESHYDRAYLALFRHAEETGKIKPGDKVLETTSGTAGVSFGGIGRILGYNCYIALPAGGEKAREDAILKHLPDKDHLILTPAEDYVSGFPKFLKEFLTKNKDYYFLNHSMGPKGTNNETTLSAFEEIGREIKAEIKADYFIPAIGNGSSLLGPARALKPETKVVPFETFQSAVAYDLVYPGKYESEFGIKPGTLSRHRLPGTSFQGINFPHIQNAVDGGFIDDVILVSDERMDKEYCSLTNKTNSTRLPHWDKKIEYPENFGRTTLAGINVALEVARKVSGKNLVVIAYDKIDRYDSK